MKRYTVDCASEHPIVVKDGDAVRTFDHLDIVDRSGNTVAQIDAADGNIEVTILYEAFPSVHKNNDVARRAPRRERPCGCLDDNDRRRKT